MRVMRASHVVLAAAVAVVALLSEAAASDLRERALLRRGRRGTQLEAGHGSSNLTVRGYVSKKDACKACYANKCKAHCLVGKCFKMYGEPDKQMWCTACGTTMKEALNDMNREDICSAGFNQSLPQQPVHTRWWFIHHTKQVTADYMLGPLRPTTTTTTPAPVKKTKKKRRKKRKGRKGRKGKKAKKAGKKKGRKGRKKRKKALLATRWRLATLSSGARGQALSPDADHSERGAGDEEAAEEGPESQGLKAQV